MAAPVEKLTWILVECELTTFNEDGLQKTRRPAKFDVAEADIPADVRDFLLSKCPTKPR